MQTPAGFKQRFNIDVRTGTEVIAIEPTPKPMTVRNLPAGREYLTTATTSWFFRPAARR